ncbi:hypothetical protein C8J57DRAFT_1227986 [Mycena rebaudengoi]|nr:hypothetical protein C8J57DRAFT_1227986 [Mycena rebaudengoi]
MEEFEAKSVCKQVSIRFSLDSNFHHSNGATQSKPDQLEKERQRVAAYYEKKYVQKLSPMLSNGSRYKSLTSKADIRKKRRLQMAEKRAKVKAKRRVSEKRVKSNPVVAREGLDLQEFVLPPPHEAALANKRDPRSSTTHSEHQDLEAAHSLLHMRGDLEIQQKDWADDLPGSDDLLDTEASEVEQDMGTARPLTPIPPNSPRRRQRLRLPTPISDSPSPDNSGKMPSLYDKMDDAYGLDSRTRPF